MADIFNKEERRKRLAELGLDSDNTDLEKAIKNYSAFSPSDTEEAQKRDDYLRGSYENRGAQEQFIRDRMNANDWAEAAQTLAGALTKYGAARAGLKSGYDMSGVTAGPGVDYSARNDRLLRELSQQAESGDREVSRTLGRYDTAIEGQRRSLEDAVKNARILNENERADRREERAALMGLEGEDRRAEAVVAQERMRQQAEAARDVRQEKALKQQDLRTRLQDLSKEEQQDAAQAKLLQSQVNELRAARNAYLNPNTSSKDKEKAIEKLKGLSPGERQALDEVKDKQPGFFGKLFGKTNDEAQQALDKLPLPEELQSKLDELAARKQSRDQAKQELGLGKAASPKPESKVESDEVLVEFKGKKLSIPRSQLPAALKDGAVQLSK